MFENGVPIKIGGRTYTMVFTLAALLQLTNRYGGVQGMVDTLTGPTILPTDDEKTVAEKNKQQEAAQEKALSEIPWLVTTLANQGIMLETGRTDPMNPDLLDTNSVALLMMPRDLSSAMGAIMDCIAVGMGSERKADVENAPRDLILEEIDRKNVMGAAE